MIASTSWSTAGWRRAFLRSVEEKRKAKFLLSLSCSAMPVLLLELVHKHSYRCVLDMSAHVCRRPRSDSRTRGELYDVACEQMEPPSCGVWRTRGLLEWVSRPQDRWESSVVCEMKSIILLTRTFALKNKRCITSESEKKKKQAEIWAILKLHWPILTKRFSFHDMADKDDWPIFIFEYYFI